ncbi:MAG: hypothetical protein ACTSWG_13295 [Candidatus Helarchaeota archaeon]
MKIFLKINGETYGLTRPDEDDKYLSFWDLYAMFYKITRMSGHCTDELDNYLGCMGKDVDGFLQNPPNFNDLLGDEE